LFVRPYATYYHHNLTGERPEMHDVCHLEPVQARAACPILEPRFESPFPRQYVKLSIALSATLENPPLKLLFPRRALRFHSQLEFPPPLSDRRFGLSTSIRDAACRLQKADMILALR